MSWHQWWGLKLQSSLFVWEWSYIRCHAFTVWLTVSFHFYWGRLGSRHRRVEWSLVTWSMTSGVHMKSYWRRHEIMTCKMLQFLKCFFSRVLIGIRRSFNTTISYIVCPEGPQIVMTSWSHNISGQISRKLLEIADSFLFGAYRKVAKGSQMVTSPMTSRNSSGYGVFPSLAQLRCKAISL